MPDRREFLRASGIALTYVIGAQTLILTPADAYAKGLPLRVLDSKHVETIETLAEAIVPGARKAGIAHYIDSQLAASVDSSLLMIKYLGVPAPYTSFYTSSLEAAMDLAKAEYKSSWPALSKDKLAVLVDRIAGGEIETWQGPPPGFFFFVLRADACDVVYGTTAGHASIDFPHMAHIQAEQEW